MSDPTQPGASAAGDTPPSPEGLNPELKRTVDPDYAEAQHGSTPLETVSVKKQGPAVWPVIWAVTVIAMVLITLFLIFG